MNTLSVPVSVGELLDKISILEIKSERIKSVEKRAHVELELRLLRQRGAAILARDDVKLLLASLQRVNEQLWDVEDQLRDHERAQHFDSEFIRLARSVYHLNDERAAIKRQLNELLGSELVEEKSYSSYSSNGIPA